MTAAPLPYKELSHWFLTHIRPSSSAPNDRGEIDARITPSSALKSADRFAIYKRGYFARLLEAFRHEYPALQALTGEALFKSFVAAYLEHSPPNSYSLNQLAAHFPDFLKVTKPADNPAVWMDGLIELAKIERACYEIHDGQGYETPGAEATPPLISAEDLMRLSLDAFTTMTLTLNPSARLFKLTHKIADYLSAFRRSEAPAGLETGETYLLILRVNYQLRLLTIEDADYGLISPLLHCESGTISFEQIKQNQDEAFSRLRLKLLNYADMGLFVALAD